MRRYGPDGGQRPRKYGRRPPVGKGNGRKQLPAGWRASWRGERGLDWRVQIKRAPADARGLGAMEGNLAHLIANRMKGQGRSWSRQGAIHMAKVREQVVNGTLRRWWRRPSTRPSFAPRPSRTGHPRHRRQDDVWLQARLPALQGSYARNPFRLWLEHTLRHRLN